MDRLDAVHKKTGDIGYTIPSPSLSSSLPPYPDSQVFIGIYVAFKYLSSIFFVCIVILVNQFTTLQQNNTNEIHIYCKGTNTSSAQQLETGALHQQRFQRHTSTSMT